MYVLVTAFPDRLFSNSLATLIASRLAVPFIPKLFDVDTGLATITSAAPTARTVLAPSPSPSPSPSPPTAKHPAMLGEGRAAVAHDPRANMSAPLLRRLQPGNREPLMVMGDASVDMPALVLVVDDDQDIREALYELFEGEGYQVLLAADGLEALHLLRQTPSPVVVVTDHMMPRLDGPGLIDVLLDDPPLAARTQVVYMTATNRLLTPNLLARFQDLAVHIVRKPFDLEELTICLAEAQERLRTRVRGEPREGYGHPFGA